MNDHPSHSRKVGRLYDRLLLSESDQLEEKKLTIHKKLHFPQSLEYKDIVDINDWVRSKISISDTAHILDAGCGVGGTLFSLIDKARTGLGITLSKEQLKVAQNESQRLGLNDKLQFILQSYDAPLNESFDLIISIESLAHSAHLLTSIRNLSKHLKPNGQIVIVEDMVQNGMITDKNFEVFKKSWHLQSVYSEFDYQKCLEISGLEVVNAIDLSKFISARKLPNWVLRLSWHLIQIVPERIQRAKDIFIGGLILENLYAQNQMKYKILIAQKA